MTEFEANKYVYVISRYSPQLQVIEIKNPYGYR